MTFDKKEYQRELMRKRRAKRGRSSVLSPPSSEKDLPVPVLAEPSVVPISHGKGEARESAATEPTKIRNSLGGQSIWDKEKYPVRKAWEIAVVRAERAKRYAEKFPEFIRDGDVKYQDVGWQYEHEGLASIRRKGGPS